MRLTLYQNSMRLLRGLTFPQAYLLSLILLLIVFLIVWFTRGKERPFLEKIKSGMTSFKSGVRYVWTKIGTYLDELEEVVKASKALQLIFLSLFFLYFRIIAHKAPLISSGSTVLLLYTLYALILETSTKLQGIKFPNAYKILIAIVGFFTILLSVSAVTTAYVTMNWADNIPDIITAIAEGLDALLTTFFSHIDEIKDFILWLNELANPSPVTPA